MCCRDFENSTRHKISDLSAEFVIKIDIKKVLLVFYLNKSSKVP